MLAVVQLSLPRYFSRTIPSSLTPCEFVSSRNALLQPERLFQQTSKPPEAHAQVARSLRRCRHSCCLQANTCFQSIAATLRAKFSRVDRHFDPLSKHLRCSSGVSTSCTSCRGCHPRCRQYHQGCDRGNAECSSTCRRDSTSFPRITPDGLNLTITEIRPEQGRLGEAHPPIAPTLPPYRQCTHRADCR
jgi:hypothetical protein